MVYKTRQGITLLNICGTNLLIATRPLWQTCPRVRPLPKFWAACWSIMSNGRNSEEAIMFFSDFLHRTPEELKDKCVPIFETLSKEGFLIPVEDEE